MLRYFDTIAIFRYSLSSFFSLSLFQYLHYFIYKQYLIALIYRFFGIGTVPAIN